PLNWLPVSTSVTLRLFQINVFHNASSTDVAVMALLGDLETHSLACSTCKIRFLQPWAQIPLPSCGPTSSWHLTLCLYPSLYCCSLLGPPDPHPRPPALPVPDPFVTQVSLGCEMHPNGTSRGFYDAAGNGEDIVSFEADTGKWVARQGDKLALYARDLLNQDKGTAITLQFLLRTTCVNQLNSFVQHGKESLERQGEAGGWLSRAPLPAGTPAPVLLVCRVTGFYPRSVRVAWLQDEEEVTPGWWLNSSGILPNADLTYQLCSSLAVGPGAGHSYACRVQHSSLGGQTALHSSLGQEVKGNLSLLVTAVGRIGVWLGQRGQRLTLGS
uniref:Ig-like domain-containing protein n=1 Tax=Chelonoidis abingdonii TaxID=106734 RepID=A0A8C0HDC2_CHEAB